MAAPQTYDPAWAQGIQDHTGFVWPPIPPEPPWTPDPMVIAQIAREPFKANGTPKQAFDIITSNVDTGKQWMTLPYTVKLGETGFGWISGDKHGYQGAYFFLVQLATGRVAVRGYVTTVEGAAYSKVNDRYMDEIQTTKIGFDGKAGNPPEQGQGPGAQEDYEPNDDPPSPPVVFINYQGAVIETRPYTMIPLGPGLKFRDGGLNSTPFEANNGYNNAPHTVYQRQTVLLDVETNGVYNPAIVIYYDSLWSQVTITR